MKVGIVCPYSWDAPGGVRSHVSDLAMALIEHGHDVSVLAPLDDGQDVPEWVVDGGRPVAVPYNGSVARLNFGIKATRNVRRWIRDGEFDVLHVHEPVAPGLSLLACWVARGPIVATWHSSNPRSRMLSAGYYIAQTAMEKLSGRIAVSEQARRTLVAHVGGDAVLIPNGVRVSDFTQGEPLDVVRASVPSILFLGRVDEPRKGFDVLVAALPAIIAAIPTIQVFVVGPCDIDELSASLDPKVLPHVHFLGRVSDEEKVRALRSVDLYVAPHTGGESFGIVLIEAMAARTAVVASSIPAFRQVLEEGLSGAIFENENPQDLAAQVVRVLSDHPAREEYAEQGWRRVQEFDWDRVVDEVIAVYESVAVVGEKVTVDLRGQIVGRLGTSRNQGDGK
jgi:phosphatidylinositol alpha-mannosyltransferase